MRTTKLLVLGVLLVTFTALATDVVDLCRVQDDGSVAWDPHVKTRAVRRYGVAMWHVVAPPKETQAARAPAPSPARR